MKPSPERAAICQEFDSKGVTYIMIDGGHMPGDGDNVHSRMVKGLMDGGYVTGITK